MADVTDGNGPHGPVAHGPVAQGSVGARAGMAVQIMGAAMSLAILGGIGVWGYKLIVRDASGLPVVRAMTGPMREAPISPGGDIVDHLGLSVNAVAGRGEAAPPEDRLVLAPPTSDLTDEDLMVQPTAEAEEYLPEAQGGLAGSPEAVGSVAAAAPSLPSSGPMTAADILAFADSISNGATPLAPLADAPLTETPTVSAAVTAAVTVAVTAPAVIPAEPQTDGSSGGRIEDLQADATIVPEEIAAPPAELAAVAPDTGAVPDSETAPDAETAPVTVPPTFAGATAAAPAIVAKRPPERPGSLTDAIAAAGPEVAASFAVSTAEVPLGTPLVQLGAFDSPALAGAEWTRLAGRFDAFLTGKERLIQEAASGGRAFFRLRAMGFEDIADARRFCSALVAEDAPCIPVVVQ